MANQKRFMAQKGLDNNNNTIVNVTDPVNNQDAATKAYVDSAKTSANTYTDTKVANLVASAPAALDTLNELATALGNDASFATTVTNSLAGKVATTTTVTGTGALSGGGALSGNQTITHTNSGVTAGTYNNVTVNAYGHVTAGSNSSYLTGNQTVTLSGDATGSGATSIALTLANSGVTAGTYTKVTVDAKGRVTSGATASTTDITEGTNLYFTNARASAAAPVQSVFGRTGAVTLASSDVTGALGFTPENSANKGVANGYAGLDATGKVPAAQLPSFVDDVLEYTNLAGFPATGSAGIIYVALDTNKVYRWSGSAYVEISAAPGTTDAVTEGSTNLYFTTARARAAISASGNISYNSSTGVITTSLTQYTDALATTAARAAHSVTGGTAAYNTTTGVITVPTTSAHITESGNLFYTDARARAALSFTAGSGAYNSTTGVITIPTNTNQLTNGAGFITGYTETDTLATVTGRGATTTANISTGSVTSSNIVSAANGYQTTAYLTNQRNRIWSFGNADGYGLSYFQGTSGRSSTDSIGFHFGTASDAGSQFVMQSNGTFIATGELTAYSDAKVKTNVKTIENALDIVTKMRGVTFDRIQDGKASVGVIAQEVKEVLPQVVNYDEQADIHSVAYGNIVGVLIEAIKAQQVQIAELSAEVAKLKK